MCLQAAITEEKGYTFRCADEETFEKVKRAIEKMDSEDFIIKVNEVDAENVKVSLNGNSIDLLAALGILVETLITDTDISPAYIGNIVADAIRKGAIKKRSEEK